MKLEEKQPQFWNMHQILITGKERYFKSNFGQEFFYWRSNVNKCVFSEIIPVPFENHQIIEKINKKKR